MKLSWWSRVVDYNHKMPRLLREGPSWSDSFWEELWLVRTGHEGSNPVWKRSGLVGLGKKWSHLVSKELRLA